MSVRPAAEHLRLAELVGALSLGIDLGFGQPMEHVLRQCLIALRLGERVSLAEEDRAAVYYTALLINVGCHTDAHEQAKWFGDDIALKSTKYDHALRACAARPTACERSARATPRCSASGSALEFAVSGRRDVDGMIEHHAGWRACWPSSSGCPRRSSTRSAPHTSSGTARAGPGG